MDQNVTDMQIAGWLINTPATDGNFKISLAKANAATIRFAMASAQGSTKKKALETALKKLERQGIDPDSEAALEVVEAVEGRKQSVQEEQLDRESRIAECYEVIGRVQANTVASKFANVSNLVWLRKVKDSKIYRDLPHVGTWDKFCDYLGLSRAKVDVDLLNLSVFGEEFLLTCQQLSVGYREMRKLRQLTCDGTVTIDEAEICIGGEVIPFTPEHRDDLQAALERVIETNAKIISDKEATIKAKDKVLKSKAELIERQAKELSKLEDSAAFNGMTPLEEKIIQDCDNARTMIDGFLLKFDPDYNPLPEDATPRMMAAYMGTLAYFRRAIIGACDSAGERYGDIDLPEHQWIPPHLRNAGEE